MHVGPLYEHAVALSPRAARIAAALLAEVPAIPLELRRSLRIALHATDTETGGAGFAGKIAAEAERGDREAREALAFVEACKRVCQ